MGGTDICSQVFFNILVWCIKVTKFQEILTRQTFGPLRYWARKKQHLSCDWLPNMLFHFKYVAYFMLNISERQRSDVSFSFEIWSHLCVKLVYWKIPMSNYLGCPKNYRKVVVLLFCNLKNAFLYKMTILRSFYDRRRYFLTGFLQYTSLIYIFD